MAILLWQLTQENKYCYDSKMKTIVMQLRWRGQELYTEFWSKNLLASGQLLEQCNGRITSTWVLGKHMRMEPAEDTAVLNVLTGASVSVGKAEVVDSIQSQQVVEKLLLLILAAEERVAFVLAPATIAELSNLGLYSGSRSVLSSSKPYLSNAESESRVRRCLDRSFFSSDSRTHALA